MSETREDRQRGKARMQAADNYGEMGDRRAEKHWSDKAREEMTERDWRIFREDFSISYKSNKDGTLPMRNWEEAGLPLALSLVLLVVVICLCSHLQLAMF